MPRNKINRPSQTLLEALRATATGPRGILGGNAEAVGRNGTLCLSVQGPVDTEWDGMKTPVLWKTNALPEALLTAEDSGKAMTSRP